MHPMLTDTSKNGLVETHSRLHFTSTFYPLLRSNVIPSTEECESVMEFIRVQESQLAAVTNTLAILRKVTERLEIQKAVIEESIGYRRCYLSSIRRLPVEILQEIFLYCNPEDRVEICSPQRDLWHIGQVCSQWRGALLSLRSLWRRVHFDFNVDARVKHWIDSGAGYDVFNRRIQACFQRAGEHCPVSITFQHGSGIPWYTLAQLLGEYSNQWGEFSASLGTWNIRHISALFDRKAEALKSVHIEGHNYEGRVLGFFSSTPQLSCLSLASVRHPYHTIFPVNSSAQITTFVSTENMFLPGEMLEILKLLPNLERFESNYDYGIESIPFDDFVLELPHLSCLKLRARTIASFILLDYLLTPLLSHMDIHLKVTKTAVDITNYAQTTTAFIRRASESLTRISVGNIPEYFVEELALGVDADCLIEVYGSEMTNRSSSFKSLFNRHQIRVVEPTYPESRTSWF